MPDARIEAMIKAGELQRRVNGQPTFQGKLHRSLMRAEARRRRQERRRRKVDEEGREWGPAGTRPVE